MYNNHVSMDDYLSIIRRRKMAIISPFALILVITLGLAFGLPPVYQSTATILIEQQEIPQDLVPSTVASYAAERIQVISKRVMARANIWQLIEEFDLFPEDRHLQDKNDLIFRVRQNINVKMVSADVFDPRSRRAGKAAIAFDISFKAENPDIAQQVAKKLVALFLHENVRMRTQKAEVTSDFLAEEASRLGAEISKLEATLADFKERNVGRLPQQLDMNMSLLDRTGRELETVERQLYILEERKMALETQLAQLEPNTAQSPAQRLNDLRAEYLRASALYSSDHPDVVRMQREIEFLERQVGYTDSRDDLEKQILEVRAELNRALESYSEGHPDIVKLKNTLAVLNGALQKLPAESLLQSGLTIKPDNPPYIAVLTQREGVKINIIAERERRARLREKLDLYEKRILAIPGVEQEWLILRRDYDNAIKKYKEIKQNQLQAEVSEKLERDSKGERFSIIDTPELPSMPIEPNRLGILLLGTVFSLVGGVTIGAFSEFMDRTIRGAKAVTRLLQAPPLSVIPRIENRQDLLRRRNSRRLAIGLPVILLLLIILLVHFFWMPVDTIWSIILDNNGTTE